MRHKISFRLLLGLIWLSFILVIFVLVSATMISVSRASLSQIQHDLHDNIATQINQKVNTRLLSLESVLQFNQSQLKEVITDIDELSALSPYFYNQLVAFEHIDGIFFGAENGLFTGYGRIGNDDLQLMHVTSQEERMLRFYETDTAGTAVRLATTSNNFDPRTRPWYQDAIKQEQAVRGQMFVYQAFERYALPLSVKIYDKDDKFVGVFGINLFADFIDAMLNQLLISEKDRLIIINSDGHIISQSAGVWSRAIEKHYLSDQFLMRVAEQYRQLTDDELATAQGSFYFDVMYDQQPFSVSISSINYRQGTNWLVINAFHNDEYLIPLKQAYWSVMFWLVVIFVLCSLAFLFFVNKLSNTLQKFVGQIRDFSVVSKSGLLTIEEAKLLHDSNISELQQIAVAFNKLTENLSHSLQQQNSSLEQINRLARVVQTANDMVVLCNAEGKIEWVNHSFETVSGYQLTDCIGEHPGSLLQGESTDKQTVRSISYCLKAKQPFSGRLLNYRNDGSSYWVELSIHPVMDDDANIIEFFSLQRDISQQVKFENELSVWKQIFHGARWGIAISRGKTGILGEHNPHFAYMLGYQLDELIGKPLTDIYAESEHEKIPRFIRRIDIDGFVSFESVMIKKDGTLLPALVNVSQVTNRDSSESFRVANIQDLSELKALEKQLRESNKMEALGSLTRGIVHDFNNILAATIVNAEMCQLLLEKSRSKHAAKTLLTLHNIITASERAAELINQILLFSRNETVEKTMVSLLTVLDGVEKLIVANLQPGVNFKISNLTSDNLLQVKGNRSQLHQLFINLLSNGADAIAESGKGGGKLTVSLTIVDHTDFFALTSFDFWIKVAVSDTGTGISTNVMDKMFEPLYTTKEEGKGTGLGLSLVQNIVQNHQGFVRCESEVGQGSSFYVYLPYERFNQLNLADENNTDTEAFQQVTGLTLLVDDNTEFLLTLGQLLEQQQLNNKCFTSPHMARAFFERHGKDIELAFFDFNMPGMNGIELARHLRQYNQSCFIVLVSGSYPDEYAEAIKDGTLNNFIIKPITLQRVLTAVEQSLVHISNRRPPDNKEN